MAKKFYAVRCGRKEGIFTTWEECRAQVSGFSGAEYRSFLTLDEAAAYLENAPAEEALEEDAVVAYVDGSYDQESNCFSYGMVILEHGEEKTFSERFEDPELAAMRNVAGEIKGAEAAMAYALANNRRRLVIYHDYEGIAKWCLGEWKANKEGTKAYRAYYELARQRVEIRFCKVTGHSGDHYNDYADRLAKEALGLISSVRSAPRQSAGTPTISEIALRKGENIV